MRKSQAHKRLALVASKKGYRVQIHKTAKENNLRLVAPDGSVLTTTLTVNASREYDTASVMEAIRDIEKLNASLKRLPNEGVHISKAIDSKYRWKLWDVYEEEGVGRVLYYVLQEKEPDSRLADMIFKENPDIQAVYAILRDRSTYDLEEDLERNRGIRSYLRDPKKKDAGDSTAPISPEEQKEIRELFKSHNIEIFGTWMKDDSWLVQVYFDDPSDRSRLADFEADFVKFGKEKGIGYRTKSRNEYFENCYFFPLPEDTNASKEMNDDDYWSKKSDVVRASTPLSPEEKDQLREFIENHDVLIKSATDGVKDDDTYDISYPVWILYTEGDAQDQYRLQADIFKFLKFEMVNHMCYDILTWNDNIHTYYFYHRPDTSKKMNAGRDGKKLNAAEETQYLSFWFDPWYEKAIVCGCCGKTLTQDDLFTFDSTDIPDTREFTEVDPRDYDEKYRRGFIEGYCPTVAIYDEDAADLTLPGTETDFCKDCWNKVKRLSDAEIYQKYGKTSS